jgi:hypothetical protein
MKNSTKSSKASRLTVLAVFAIFFTAAILFNASNSYSQDNSTIEGVVYNFVIEGSSPKVLQPYADALSSDMNSGLFHTAKVKKGFSMYFGIKGTGTYINGDNPLVKENNKTLDILPMAVPQIQVGAVFGTEFSVRFLPSVSFGKYGSVGTWGVGVKHCITSHFKKSPLDAAIGFSTNNLTFSDSKDRDMVNASSIAVNLQVSRELSVFTIYTGVQYENTSVNVDVRYNGENTKMSYENENKVRGIIGLNIKLGPLNLNGDYSMGKTNSVSAGFGFAF